MDIAVFAAFNNVAYRVGWVSLQPGGDVSVGLNARALVTPDFEAKEFVWSAFNRIQVAYFVPEDPRAAKPLMEPHLTFHAPDYLHLTAKNKKGKGKPFEAIAPIELAVRQQGVVPWVRFISRRVGLLAQGGAAGGGTRHRQRTLTFEVPSLPAAASAAARCRSMASEGSGLREAQEARASAETLHRILLRQVLKRMDMGGYPSRPRNEGPVSASPC